MSDQEPTCGEPDPIDFYFQRMWFHIGELAAGRDPAGHMFALERLARAARAETVCQMVIARRMRRHGP